eukprot:7130-Heterococcus_DN1.PRE.2
MSKLVQELLLLMLCKLLLLLLNAHTASCLYYTQICCTATASRALVLYTHCGYCTSAHTPLTSYVCSDEQ